MDSLSHECTASKHRYDQCFNAWFEGYLKPIVAQPEDASSGLVEEEEEEELLDDEECEEEDEELLIEDEPVTLLDAAALPNAHGSPQHHHHSHHHHPSWSLRNEDRHPDLWPWSRGSKSSSARVVKTAVTPTTPEPVKADEISPQATSDESELPTRTADTQRSKQNVASAIPLTTSSPVEQRAQWAKAQKEEYDRNCGALWTDYRECLQRAIDTNHPLSALLNQARLENPIEEAEAYEDGGYGAPDAQP